MRILQGRWGAMRSTLISFVSVPVQHPVIDGHVTRKLVARDRGGMNERNFLRHHADIDGVAPEIFVGVDAESVVAMAQQCDVALEADIGDPYERRVIFRIGAVAPGAAAVNAGIASLPWHRSASRSEVPSDAGRYRLELCVHVDPLRGA